jgi:hypothetical protein
MPRRKMLHHVEAKKWEQYALDGDVDEVIKKIGDAAKEATEAGYSGLRFSVDDEGGWGGDSVIAIKLVGSRRETLDEMRKRVKKKRAHDKNVEDRDLAQLAALQAKYGMKVVK